MEDQREQKEAFAKLSNIAMIPEEQQPDILKGVSIFFAHGWPSDYFTVGMARSAATGLIPEQYESFASMAKY
jgi:hypothetical protein